MNILLSEIRALTSDLQELPEAVRGDGANFTRLLQQQLSINPASGTQPIEIKDLYRSFPGEAVFPDSVPASPANVAWTDFPPQRQVRIVGVAEPVAATSVESPTTLPPQPQSTSLAIVQRSTVTGDQLPAGGNSLPVAERDGLQLAKRAIEPAAPRQKPVTAAVNAESGVAGPAPDSVRLPVTPELVAGTGAARDRATAEIPADKAPAWNTLPATARAAGLRPPPATGVVHGKPGGAEGVRRDAVIDRSIPTASVGLARLARSDIPGNTLPSPAGLSPSPANGLAPGVILSRASGPKEFGLPPLPSVTPSAAVKAAVVGGSPPTASVGGEIVGIPDAFKASMPPPNSANEAVVTEFTANRSRELPAQVSAYQAQPTLAALTAGGQGPAAAAPAMAAVHSVLPVPLDSLNPAPAANAVEWGDDLGRRVNWMINQKQNSATIRLDPPLLGKLDVQVKLADDATLITIQTQHAQTRDLIETAAVRLRDFLQESGYQNVNVDVSQRQDQQPQRAQTPVDDGAGEAEASMMEQEQGAIQQHSDSAFIGDGLLDIFA